MTAYPEGTPCWADLMSADLAGVKDFYGDVLGWTFADKSTEFGGFTEAYADGKAVAAVVPPMSDDGAPSAWCLYFASHDAEATAAKIRDNGGEVLAGPTRIDGFGTTVTARDPAGVTFGVWQADQRQGFDQPGEPGGYCWAEIFTREPELTDAFFSAVFPYRAQRIEDEQMDFKIFSLGEGAVLGRMAMGEEFPAEVPAHIQVYFAVDDCDAAVARVTERGGALHFGPMDTPFGRFASIADALGAGCALIDVNKTAGELPEMVDVP